MTNNKRVSDAFPKAKRGGKLQRKLFIIVGEGERTEKEYFDLFPKSGNVQYALRYSCPSNHHGGNMIELVETMEKEKSRHSRPSKAAPTEYWIVADIESESANRDFSPLINWVKESNYNHLGLTNRQFENWLLLHFRKGMACADPVRELSRYIPQYNKNNKGLCGSLTDLALIRTACDNAKSANVVCSDCPKSIDEIRDNSTSLPHLIEQLI